MRDLQENIVVLDAIRAASQGVAEANARAKMLIYLIENKLVDVKKI